MHSPRRLCSAFRRLMASAALWMARRDKENGRAKLDAKSGNLKAALCRAFEAKFAELREQAESGDALHTAVAMLRPAWLTAHVARALLRQLGMPVGAEADLDAHLSDQARVSRWQKSSDYSQRDNLFFAK